MAQPETGGSYQDFSHNGMAVLLAIVFGGLAALWFFWAESLLQLGLLATLTLAAAYGLARLGRRTGGVMREVLGSNNRTKIIGI